MRFELSRKAEADLDDIRDYSVGQFGVDRTIDYLDALEHAFSRILNFPDIGPARPDIGERMRSLPVGEHRIFYERESQSILILRVLHKRMDLERYL